MKKSFILLLITSCCIVLPCRADEPTRRRRVRKRTIEKGSPTKALTIKGAAAAAGIFVILTIAYQFNKKSKRKAAALLARQAKNNEEQADPKRNNLLTEPSTSKNKSKPDSPSPILTQKFSDQPLSSLDTKIKGKKELRCLKLNRKDIDEFYADNKAHFRLQGRKDMKLSDARLKDWLNRTIKGFQDENGKIKTKKQLTKNYNSVIPERHIQFARSWVESIKSNNPSWTEFEGQIKKVAENAIEKMKDKKHLYFLVPGGIKKSNTWMFFVFWRFLKDSIPKEAECHFISRESVGNIDYNNYDYKISAFFQQNNINYYEDSAFFVFDDMSYSGLQLKTQLSFFIDSNEPTVYLVIPYLANTAMAELKAQQDTKKAQAQSNIKVLKDTKIIRTLKMRRKIGNYDMEGGNSTSTTPFQGPHKIADSHSVMHRVLVTGATIHDIIAKRYTKKEMEDYKPVSLFEEHTYKPYEAMEIKEGALILYESESEWESDSDEEEEPLQPSPQSDPETEGPFYKLFDTMKFNKEIPDHLLPIKAANTYKNQQYKYKKYTFSSDSRVGIFQKLYDLKMRASAN